MTCSSSRSNIGTAVGAGVGVPLGLAAIGFLTFLFWRERRHQVKERNAPGNSMEAMAMAPEGKYGMQQRKTALEAPTEAWHPPSELNGSN